MEMTGARWLLLLTIGREVFGSSRSQRAQRPYEALEQVAQRAVPARNRGLVGGSLADSDESTKVRFVGPEGFPISLCATLSGCGWRTSWRGSRPMG